MILKSFFDYLQLNTIKKLTSASSSTYDDELTDIIDEIFFQSQHSIYNSIYRVQ